MGDKRAVLPTISMTCQLSEEEGELLGGRGIVEELLFLSGGALTIFKGGSYNRAFCGEDMYGRVVCGGGGRVEWIGGIS